MTVDEIRREVARVRDTALWHGNVELATELHEHLGRIEAETRSTGVTILKMPRMIALMMNIGAPEPFVDMVDLRASAETR